AQPMPDEPGTPGLPENPNTVSLPDLTDDTDGDLAPSDRPKLPLSSEEAYGEPADD
ncbi:MAG: hypothetical protein IT534_05180, partial [Bauldia sp.]|nr:hypothetical protein [Bauldia sp.]